MKKIYLGLIFSTFYFSIFSQNYTILGSASSSGGCNCFQLTPDANDQHGAIFQNQTINLNNSFDFTFNVFLGCNGASGADGIVFALTSNPNGLGSAGEGLGYAGPSQPYSLAVEFDTWQNGPPANDPPYDHIGIESGGQYNHNVAGAVPALVSQSNIDNCQWHTVRIVWDVNTSTYTVYFDGVIRQQIVIPNIVSTYFNGNPVVNWGWTGATGGGTNLQQVCVTSTSNWVAGTNYQSCDLAVQFTDISTSSLGSVQSWAWTFGDGGTSTLQNPVHTYTATGTYTVTLVITDISGCTNTYTHIVTINPPIAIPGTITPPLCNGAATGNITVTASGGFGPAAGYGGYMYNWSNGTTNTNQVIGAAAGTYTLTVTDGVCTSTAQYTVSQPTAVTATTAHTDAPCGNNGTATITASGGTPPYNVNWAGFAAVSGVPLSMPAGTWIADLHDANGCSALLQYRETISQLPCGITSSLTTTNVSCYGGNNGTATLTVGGGSGGSVAGWTTAGGGVFTITGLASGTYNYTYTDANSALNFPFTVNITQPGAAIVASLATVNMSCANTNDGQALASVLSGGTAPYSYTWSPPGTNNPVATNLGPGPVTVTVTDANTCTATAMGTITGPPTLTLNITTVDDSCYQSHLGSAMANVGGGNAPYLYYWSNISSAQNNLSLGIGTYTVTVTDDKGCTITGSATINQPTPFTHTIAATNVTGSCSTDGTITVTQSGGTPGYSYTWSPNTAVGSNPTGLGAGQYNLTLTDAHNCQILDSIVISSPAGALAVTTSHTDATCHGASNGTVTITISGGVPPYSYLGNPVPPGTTTLPGVPAGTYGGNVTDASGCSVPVMVIVSEPGPQSLDTMNVIDNSCNGGITGSISVNFVNATGVVTYNWNPGGNQNASRSGLTSGIYNITATDANACTVSVSVTVNEPAAPLMSVTTIDATCFGNDGSATANPTGAGPFNYIWSSGGTNAQTINVPAGTYTVSASDTNSCNQSASFTINEPVGIAVAETHTDLQCFGDANGSINLTPSGGAGPNYTYAWSPNVSTGNSASSLTAGMYIITITDQAMCPSIDTITLVQPLQAVTVNIQSNNITCFGLSNGSITINATGGTGVYTYTWNPNVSSTNTASGLVPATYNITVADANNCSVVPMVTISQPNQPLTLVTDSTNLTCFQSNDGTASITVSGGTFPYSYSWTPNTDTVNSITGLAAGIYTVNVTDRNQCTNSASFNITQPTQLVTSETHTNISCFGDVTGTVYITASGSVPSYTYSWSPNVSSVDSAVNVGAANYNVTVADANGCSVVQTANVTEPPLLALNPTVSDVLCNGQSTGAIDAGVVGGVPAYNFSATDGTNSFSSTTGQFSSLYAGNYSITVTDQNTCSASVSVTVSQSNVLSVTTDTFPSLCYRASNGRIVVSPVGGILPYTISLSNGNTNHSGLFTGLGVGTYYVTVADSNGCAVMDTAVITEPDSIFISVTPSPVEVKLGESLQLTTATNYTGTLIYDWTPDFGLSCNDCSNPVFSGVYSQAYQLVVTNQNGCKGNASFTVTVVPDYTIFIPNVFTPDGNGNNDTWQIFGNMTAIKQMQVRVFNRWGEKVFESGAIDFKWDGTYKGQLVPPGVYVYTANVVWLDNHTDSNYTGSITVLH